MKILVVAATEPEIQALRNNLTEEEHQSIDFLVTGVGMVNTTFELTRKLLLDKYDCVLNVGIAGAFDREIEIGEAVWIKREMFSEMGAEDGDDFLSLIQLGLQSHDEFPFEWGELKAKNSIELNTLSSLRQVRAITVNKVHGNENSIMQTKMSINPHVESMEGAAIFYVCLKLNIPFIQVRTISNYVEKRNRSAWNIPLALNNLFVLADNLIKELLSKSKI